MFSGLVADLQNMAMLHFAIFVAVAGALTCYLFYLIWRNLHRARVIEDTPTANVRSAPQGYIELQGRARQLPGQPLVAPLTGTPCVWFRFKIEEERRNGSSGGSNWSVVESRRSEEPFVFFDDTGDCLVDPRKSEVLPGFRKVWYGNTRWPGSENKRGLFGLIAGRRYRYTEERIDAGEIYILGWFNTGGALQTSLAEDVSALLREWKQNAKLLHQRFDNNQDGVLDEVEWHQARQAALRQVSRERGERAVQPGINSVRASEHDGQPFLISAKPQLLLTRRYRRYAAFFLLGAMAGTALLSWMLAVRF